MVHAHGYVIACAVLVCEEAEEDIGYLIYFLLYSFKTGFLTELKLIF